eukprot:Gb_29954 [translate_table: standard]
MKTLPAYHHFPAFFPALPSILSPNSNSTSIYSFKFSISPLKSTKTHQIHPARALNDEPQNIPNEASPSKVEALEARGGVGRRARRIAKQQMGGAAESKPKLKPKDWDSMTLSEKLLELYVGERGILFWLNKFAYASIFIIIGGWVLFRFVGPSLGLYQLESTLLEPTKAFGGS